MDILRIGEFDILPGEQRKIELPVAKLYTDADVSLPVHIIRAKKPGPTIFISAAVHGDDAVDVDADEAVEEVHNARPDAPGGAVHAIIEGRDAVLDAGAPGTAAE